MQEDLLLLPPQSNHHHHHHHQHHHGHDHHQNSMKKSTASRRALASVEDLLQERKNLQASIQVASFQQFDSRKKTGKPYNVTVSDEAVGSVAGLGSEFQAIRLRSGSLKRYGLTLNEFSLPSGCEIMGSDNQSNPLPPERVLLVYSKLTNTSLFQGLGLDSGSNNYEIFSPVLSMLVYDATYLNRSEALEPLGLSATGSPITIRFSASSSSNNACISFDPDSANGSITWMDGDVCTAEHLGSFANALTTTSPPSPPPPPPPSPPPTSRASSDRWKAIVGGVVGGLALLLLISGLILFIGNKWRKARFAKMELQADQGEALQTTVIRNSRAPAAADTRTQPSLERDYTVWWPKSTDSMTRRTPIWWPVEHTKFEKRYDDIYEKIGIHFYLSFSLLLQSIVFIIDLALFFFFLFFSYITYAHIQNS